MSDELSPASAAPSLAALRQARAARETLLRRILPVGVGALLIVVVATSRAKPGAGLHDASLGVSLALTGFALAVVAGFVLLAVTGRRAGCCCRCSSCSWRVPRPWSGCSPTGPAGSGC